MKIPLNSVSGCATSLFRIVAHLLGMPTMPNMGMPNMAMPGAGRGMGMPGMPTMPRPMWAHSRRMASKSETTEFRSDRSDAIREKKYIVSWLCKLCLHSVYRKSSWELGACGFVFALSSWSFAVALARSQCVSFLAMSGVAEILCLKAPDDEDDRHIRVRHGHDVKATMIPRSVQPLKHVEHVMETWRQNRDIMETDI